MPSLAEQPRQDGSCETGAWERRIHWRQTLDARVEEQWENCPARALAPAESLALSQKKWVGGMRYQVHNSQQHMEVGGSRDGQGPWDEGSRGRLPAAGDREWPLYG